MHICVRVRFTSLLDLIRLHVLKGNMLNGTEGTQFQPLLDDDTILPVFSQDLKRYATERGVGLIFFHSGTTDALPPTPSPTKKDLLIFTTRARSQSRGFHCTVIASIRVSIALKLSCLLAYVLPFFPPASFIYLADTLKNVTEYPPNCAFSNNGPSGVMNLSDAQFGGKKETKEKDGANRWMAGCFERWRSMDGYSGR